MVQNKIKIKKKKSESRSLIIVVSIKIASRKTIGSGSANCYILLWEREREREREKLAIGSFGGVLLFNGRCWWEWSCEEESNGDARLWREYSWAKWPRRWGWMETRAWTEGLALATRKDRSTPAIRGTLGVGVGAGDVVYRRMSSNCF